MTRGIRCDFRDEETGVRCERRDTKVVFGGIRDRRIASERVRSLLIAFRCPEHQ